MVSLDEAKRRIGSSQGKFRAPIQVRRNLGRADVAARCKTRAFRAKISGGAFGKKMEINPKPVFLGPAPVPAESQLFSACLHFGPLACLRSLPRLPYWRAAEGAQYPRK